METIVRGRKIPFKINEKTGEFSATYSGDTVKHPTLSGLRDALGRILKKKPLNIPCISLGGGFEKIAARRRDCPIKKAGAKEVPA